MKKEMFLITALVAVSAVAEDLYLRPSAVWSGDTFVIGSRVYKIDGIRAPSGKWGEAAKTALEKMIKGREFKFIHPGAKAHKGKPGASHVQSKSGASHVHFGVYGRDGKPQANPAVKLLYMGLAEYSRGSVDDSRVQPYLHAEAFAKKNHFGVWYK